MKPGVLGYNLVDKIVVPFFKEEDRIPRTYSSLGCYVYYEFVEDDVEVVTRFLSFHDAHRYEHLNGKPLAFRTFFLGCGDEFMSQGYTTWGDALDGHTSAVAAVGRDRLRNRGLLRGLIQEILSEWSQI